jgi:metal-responsive CopG/Arc/MetJ family transcriptional regulator
MSVTTASMIQVFLPEDLVREIDKVVDETGYERIELLRAAVRRFAFSERRWREVQGEVQARTKALGIHTEEDLEAFLDSFPADVDQ